MHKTREQLLQQGLAQAKSKGLYGMSAEIYAQAFADGYIEEYVAILNNPLTYMTQEKNLSLEQAMQLLKIPEEEQSQLRLQLKQAQATKEAQHPKVDFFLA